MWRSLLVFPLFLLLASCGDECSSYSDYSCDEIQKAEYNVYVYPPSGKEFYLGETTGLASCGNMAWAYARKNEFETNRDWSYICCMIAKGSSCYEKHR